MKPSTPHWSWKHWALALLAVTMLYLLTVPLVLHFTIKPYPSDPLWLAWYLEPYRLVHDFPPVRHYHDWCRDQLGIPHQYRNE